MSNYDDRRIWQEIGLVEIKLATVSGTLLPYPPESRRAVTKVSVCGCQFLQTFRYNL